MPTTERSTVRVELTIRDVLESDLAGLAWSGSPGHLRIGYVAYGSEPASWEQEHEDGTRCLYETTCTLLRKALC